MQPTAEIVLLGAAFVDFLVGDPRWLLHPVQIMGWAIARYQTIALRVCSSPMAQRWAGIVLAVGMIGGSGAVGYGIVALANHLHPWLGGAIATGLLASCLAGRSLRDAAEDVLKPLQFGQLDVARSQLGQYVGRDTATLSETEILRAILETVTENAVDGVMAPLFYGLLGATFSIPWSVALAIAYKAASTLDSMVGYRDAPYTYLGWASARLEDGLTWLPCRLTVVTLALYSRRPRQVWQICQRDAIADPSPNSGWSECIYAAILQVQVGGTNHYRGIVKQKPLLGDPVRPISAPIILEALSLTRFTVLLWLAIGGGLIYGL
jgi:adenosylcobinamide-phosphate synthase